jgi:uncharacterized OsmC-like protein
MIATTTPINGIDVEALQSAIAAMTADPAKAQSNWSITSRWQGGTRSDHHVEGFGIGGQVVRRPFVIKIDEPLELCGTNQYANPQEYLLAALNACMMVGYSAVSGLMGVKLTRLEVRTSGDIDLRGFLGIDSTVPAGYERLKQEVHIAGDGTPEQFEEIHAIVRATSPNFFNITRAVAVQSQLVVE